MRSVVYNLYNTNSLSSAIGYNDYHWRSTYPHSKVKLNYRIYPPLMNLLLLYVVDEVW